MKREKLKKNGFIILSIIILVLMSTYFIFSFISVPYGYEYYLDDRLIVYSSLFYQNSFVLIFDILFPFYAVLVIINIILYNRKIKSLAIAFFLTSFVVLGFALTGGIIEVVWEWEDSWLPITCLCFSGVSFILSLLISIINISNIISNAKISKVITPQNKVENLNAYDQLKKLKDLLDSGIINQEEFDNVKTKYINQL